MVGFVVKNLDSIIISTTFFVLGLLPIIFGSNNSEKQNLSFKNTCIANSNIGNIFNQNIYNQSYTENNYNTNQSTVIINNSSAATNDDPWYIIALSVLALIPLIFFYKNINKILNYSIAISISCLILFILICRSFVNINKKITISKIVFKISIRNIIFCATIVINCFIILYNINFSPSIKAFLNLTKTTDNKLMIEKVISFILNNFYDGSFVVFVAFSILFSMFLILQLFSSYLWLLSALKHSTQTKSRFSKLWNRIYYRLNKKESELNKCFWIISIIILYSLSTGFLSFIFYKIFNI